MNSTAISKAQLYLTWLKLEALKETTHLNRYGKPQTVRRDPRTGQFANQVTNSVSVVDLDKELQQISPPRLQVEQDAKTIQEKLNDLLKDTGQTLGNIVNTVKDLILNGLKQGAFIVGQILLGPYSLYMAQQRAREKELLDKAMEDKKQNTMAKRYGLTPELVNDFYKNNKDGTKSPEKLLDYLKELDDSDKGKTNKEKERNLNEELAKRIAYRLYDPSDKTDPFTVASLKYLEKHNYRVTHYIDDRDTGLTAYGLASTAGKNPKMLFRGSDDGADWKNSISDKITSGMRWGGFTQFEQNKAEIGKALTELSQSNQRVELSGHSLGGILAQEAAVEFTDKISAVTTYNSPGFTDAEVKKYMDNVEKIRFKDNGQIPKITHVMVEGDVISYIGGDKFLPGEIECYQIQSEPSSLSSLYHQHMGAIHKGAKKIEVPKFFLNSMIYSYN